MITTKSKKLEKPGDAFKSPLFKLCDFSKFYRIHCEINNYKFLNNHSHALPPVIALCWCVFVLLGVIVAYRRKKASIESDLLEEENLGIDSICMNLTWTGREKERERERGRH